MVLIVTQRSENAELRCLVYLNLAKYGLEFNPVELTALLGYKDFTDMKINFSSKDIERCRALAGPYGYTIYRMLLAQNQPLK